MSACTTVVLLKVLRQEAGGMKEGTKLYSKKDENYRLNID